MFLLSAMLWGFASLLAAGFLLWRILRFLKWRKETALSPRDQLMILLPLAALSLALTLPMLSAVFNSWPAGRTELKELTAPVESVEASQRTFTTGRGGQRQTRTSYRVFFQGYKGFLSIPENVRFNQEAFLQWAGSDDVTFLYANTGGKYTIYQIQKGDQDVFLSRNKTLDSLLASFFSHLFISLSLLFFALGCSIWLLVSIFRVEPRKQKRQ